MKEMRKILSSTFEDSFFFAAFALTELSAYNSPFIPSHVFRLSNIQNPSMYTQQKSQWVSEQKEQRYIEKLENEFFIFLIRSDFFSQWINNGHTT